MPWCPNVLLEIDVAHAKRSLRLLARRLERAPHRASLLDDPHSAAASAGDRLDDDRIPQRACQLDRLVLLGDRTVAAGQDGHAGALHRTPRTHLVAHEANDLGARADEGDVARFAHLGQVGTFGQEPIPWVNRVRARDLGGADNSRHTQIALGAARRPDAHLLVRKPDVQRVLVCLGIDGNRLDVEFPARIIMRSATSPRFAIRIFLNMRLESGREGLGAPKPE